MGTVHKSKTHILLVDKLNTIKGRCRRPRMVARDIKCTLTLENMKFIWERDKAHLLDEPSVDRIENSKGYHLNNCRFIELTMQRRIWTMVEIPEGKGPKAPVPADAKIAEVKPDVIMISDIIGVNRVALDKVLAKRKLRIVGMADVTVNEEELVQALLKVGGIPGNLCRKVAAQLLKRLVLGDQYGQSVETSGATSSDAIAGSPKSED